MTSLEIKQLLDEKYQEYCHSDFFIHTDPIQIPKLFEEKEDIEIAGFLAIIGKTKCDRCKKRNARIKV